MSTKLNESVRHERHQMPSVEYTLGQLSGAGIFSKLNANSGFWKVPLADESALLTTFITPFVRFCFKRLPFGIPSAPEHFQRRMSAILEGIDGVLCQMDDILIFGATQSQHDERIREVLKKGAFTRRNIRCNMLCNMLHRMLHRMLCNKSPPLTRTERYANLLHATRNNLEQILFC